MTRKKPSASKSRNVSLAMIALEEPLLPEPDVLQSHLDEHYPDLPQPLSVGPVERDAVPTLTIRAGSCESVAFAVATPIPWSDIEGPCETAWWWPEATEQMRNHRAHLAVSLMTHGDEPLENNLVLTKLVGAFASLTPSRGIYWGAGTIVHEPTTFIEQSRVATIGQLPLNLWIDFRLAPSSDGRYQLFTTGLSALNAKEIEIPPCNQEPDDLFDVAMGIADYVLTSGAEIGDGHTMSRSDTETLLVRYVPSQFDKGETVMRLEWMD